MGGQSDKILKVKAIALFSGGLDSILAAKVMQELGIKVEGITFETPFFSAKKAETAAKVIDLSLTVINITDAHLHMLQAPRYGYGKNMNPCIDCHTLMLKTAGASMEATGADFVFTGEVLGQRPMSQTKQSLHVVAKNSGYGDAILRPLSAQLLPETRPEREGKVDRTKLLAIQGRGRKTQIEMARNYGIVDYAPPAGGCLLTDVNFSKRLRDLFDRQPGHTIRDIELLKHGRHFRIHGNGKVIIGRNQADNQAIDELIRDGDTVLRMAD
jgi:tRNA-specific 2-thiouridylase